MTKVTIDYSKRRMCVCPTCGTKHIEKKKK
jgi:hypothetical protein